MSKTNFQLYGPSILLALVLLGELHWRWAVFVAILWALVVQMITGTGRR